MFRSFLSSGQVLKTVPSQELFRMLDAESKTLATSLNESAIMLMQLGPTRNFFNSSKDKEPERNNNKKKTYRVLNYRLPYKSDSSSIFTKGLPKGLTTEEQKVELLQALVKTLGDIKALGGLIDKHDSAVDKLKSRLDFFAGILGVVGFFWGIHVYNEQKEEAEEKKIAKEDMLKRDNQKMERDKQRKADQLVMEFDNEVLARDRIAKEIEILKSECNRLRKMKENSPYSFTSRIFTPIPTHTELAIQLRIEELEGRIAVQETILETLNKKIDRLRVYKDNRAEFADYYPHAPSEENPVEGNEKGEEHNHGMNPFQM